MKTAIVFSLLISSLSAQQFYYTFSELKGIEDFNSNTHLFPRLYSEWRSGQSYEYRNDIYHFDLQTNIDTLFLKDYSFYNTLYGGGVAITDYDFWNNNPSKYIFCYISNVFEESPSAIIKRFDSKIPNHYWLTNPPSVGISNQDDSTLYGTNSIIVNSIDGGWTWNEKNIFDYHFLNLSPYDDEVHFYSNAGGGGSLYKTTDGGNTFLQVDTNFSNSIYPYVDQEILFDKDSNYIYRKYQDYFKYYFSVSDNNGDPFSWAIKYFSDNNIFISIDYSQSGNIYLADGRRIYFSDNYGNTFSEYKVLNRNIAGIYKKPNSDKLYAATKYYIYEITPDTAFVIKHLPIDPDLLNWYPLAVGNKWVYEEQIKFDRRRFSVEVIDDTTINGKHFFKLKTFFSSNLSGISYERFDSTSGIVYRYYSEGEIPIYDFTATEVGDTVIFNEEEGIGWTMIFEQPFTQWGLNSSARYFDMVWKTSISQTYTFVKDVGLFRNFIGEITEITILLKGFIKDGVVYGDTSLGIVGVEDEDEIPTAFSLSQNYPNPFNPVTNIQYAVSSRELVTLKVYDVLGREITTLVNEEKPAGIYELQFTNYDLSSGIYYYQLKAGSFVETKKMVVLK